MRQVFLRDEDRLFFSIEIQCCLGIEHSTAQESAFVYCIVAGMLRINGFAGFVADTELADAARYFVHEESAIFADQRSRS